MDKKIIILGVAAIGAAYFLSQNNSILSSGQGEGAAGAGESKKDDTLADINVFQIPPEATVNFPPPATLDLASLLSPPPPTGGAGTSKKDDSVLKVLVGPEYSTTPEVRAGTSGGSFGGFGPYGVIDSKKEIQVAGQVKTSEPFDFFGIFGGILKWGAPQTAINLGYSEPLTKKAGTGAGGRAGIATTLGNISAVTKKDTTVGSSGVYTLSGAGVQSEYLTKSGSTQSVQTVTSAWLGLPSTGTGTIVPEGILTYQSGKSGPASDPVIVSKKGDVIAGGSAGATLASLQKTAGMEAAAQAVTRAAQIASGYVVNSKGGLQKSSGSKK